MKIWPTDGMMSMRFLMLPLLLISTAVLAEAKILPMRERAAVIDQWLETRVQTVLPALMQRSGIDMWVIISREYNEDPVLRTFLPSQWQSARRRTMLLIYDPGDGQALETLAVVPSRKNARDVAHRLDPKGCTTVVEALRRRCLLRVLHADCQDEP